MEVYDIKTGVEHIDTNAVYTFLNTQSYWAKDIPRETVEEALRHSFCVGVFYGDEQVGFARLITDYTTFAYLADVYVLDAHRGRGLSKMLMRYITDIEWVKGLKSVLLATLDAHALYSQFGFRTPDNLEKFMQLKQNTL